MKRTVFVLIILMFFTQGFPQMRNLDRKKEAKRNEYLVKTSLEVIRSFGPDYISDCNSHPIISDILTFPETFENDSTLKEKKMYGRQYYSVTFSKNTEGNKSQDVYVAIVHIWEDDGQPKEVLFNNGQGHNFYTTSFHNWKKRGIQKSDLIPYRNIK